MPITAKEAAAVLRTEVRNTIRKRSLLFLIQGAGLVAAGLLCLVYPVFASTGITALIGWLLIISGALQLVSLIGATEVPYFWLQLLSVVLALLIGWLLISRPDAGLMAVTLLMVVYLMVDGIGRLVFALMIRPMEDWQWMLLGGIVGVAVALILAANLPQASEWLIGVLLGLQLIGVGASQGYVAWRVRTLAAPGA
jgi:uncharacterized membrane protein HdeD (DUF308 family)